MAEPPFRRRSLRDELLDLAEEVVHRRGTDALSLRDLARAAGVSHGAPRTHFPDRAALLDALATRGYDRLTSALITSSHQQASPEEKLRSAAHASVAFATTEPALADLMFAAKLDEPSLQVSKAGERLFSAIRGLFDAEIGVGPLDGRAARLPLLFATMMQGIARLAAARLIDVEQAKVLVDDVVDLLAAR